MIGHRELNCLFGQACARAWLDQCRLLWLRLSKLLLKLWGLLGCLPRGLLWKLLWKLLHLLLLLRWLLGKLLLHWLRLLLYFYV